MRRRGWRGERIGKLWIESCRGGGFLGIRFRTVGSCARGLSLGIGDALLEV